VYKRQVLVLFLLSHSSVFAQNIFTFSTEPQSIGLDVLSGPITVHSDTPVAETTYITLSSTSNTGQFYSSKTSTEPIQSGSYIYISTNNSNRTIYYKDSTAGDYVITANIFNKEKTNQIGSVTQHIIIGSTQNNTNSTSTTQTEDESVSSNQNQTATSAHSSPAPLSNTENKMEFEIYAGRDRLTTVGNNLNFIAVPTKLQNISESGITYVWSFGDGTTLQGNNVNHTYKFAGEYSVVVNAKYSDKQAVSRMKVVVVLPNVSLAKIDG